METGRLMPTNSGEALELGVLCVCVPVCRWCVPVCVYVYISLAVPPSICVSVCLVYLYSQVGAVRLVGAGRCTQRPVWRRRSLEEGTVEMYSGRSNYCQQPRKVSREQCLLIVLTCSDA